jgi:8-oxo-dGTP diphosphatase
MTAENGWALERKNFVAPLKSLEEHAEKPEIERFGIGVAIISNDHPDCILMIQEKSDNDDLGTKSGAWTFPSGHIEEGESPATAAIRETKEETGRHITEMRFTSAYYYAGKMTGYAYVARVGKRDESLKIDEAEVASIRWIPIRQITAGELPLRPFVKEVITDLVNEGHLSSDPARGQNS